MNRKMNNHKMIKKILIAILLVFALVVQFSFLSYLFKAISPNKDKSAIIMTYKSSGKIDYKVILKENNFIDTNYLNTDGAYILDLIDHIQLIPSYNFKSSTKTKVAGTNKLVAKLKVYYKESSDKSSNPEVMSKEKVLDEKVMNFSDKKYINVSTYDLYLNDYLDMINEFQNQVKISVDGYLEVTEISDFSGTVGGASYNDSYSNTIKIPLSSSVVKIENSTSKAKEKSVYESDLVKTNKTVMSYIVIANIITFIIVCFLLKKLFTFTNKTEYERKIKKILSNYDDIIVNTSTILDVSKYKLIEIDEFKEILNLSRELLLPIMNFEMIKNEETWFYVIKDDILYRYIVSNEKTKKEKVK